jgi:hypothetical protein
MNKLFLTLLVGIGVGILIAPGKGSQTVQKLKDRFDGLKDNLKDGIDSMMDQERDAIKKEEKKFDSVLS